MKMKNILLFICITILGIQEAVAQKGNLHLTQIVDLAECSNLNCFDEKVRKLGFSYTSMENIENEGHKEYAYNRTISANGYDVKQAVFFYDYGNNKPLVAFSTSAIVSTDYCNEIKSQAKNN